jgi:hypothetical protein
MEGKSEAELASPSTPLPALRTINLVANTPTTEIMPGMQAEINQMAEIIRRNGDAIGVNDISAVRIKEIVGRKWKYYHSYPFEWILGFLCVSIFLAWNLWWQRGYFNRLVLLEGRMTSYEAVVAVEDGDSTVA